MSSVMVVENLAEWSEIFEEALADEGHKVRVASTVEEAKRLLEDGRFDAIVLNLHLLTDKDYRAKYVLAAVARARPLTPCVIVSGRVSNFMKKVGRYRPQLYELLSKDGSSTLGFDLDELITTVQEAIEDRAPLHRFLALIDDTLSPVQYDAFAQAIVKFCAGQGLVVPIDLEIAEGKPRSEYLIAQLACKFEDGPAHAQTISVLSGLVAGLAGISPALLAQLAALSPAGSRTYVPDAVSPVVEAPAAGAHQPAEFDLAVLRDLLADAFDAAGLWRLCYYDPRFNPVTHDVVDRPPLDNIIDVLIKFCVKQVLIPELLAEIKRQNARQYARYESRLLRPR